MVDGPSWEKGTWALAVWAACTLGTALPAILSRGEGESEFRGASEYEFRGEKRSCEAGPPYVAPPAGERGVSAKKEQKVCGKAGGGSRSANWGCGWESLGDSSGSESPPLHAA